MVVSPQLWFSYTLGASHPRCRPLRSAFLPRPPPSSTGSPVELTPTALPPCKTSSTLHRAGSPVLEHPRGPLIPGYVTSPHPSSVCRAVDEDPQVLQGYLWWVLGTKHKLQGAVPSQRQRFFGYVSYFVLFSALLTSPRSS